MNKTRRLVLLAFFAAIALALHVIESWLPVPIPVPGVKLGLANIVSLPALVVFGWRGACYVAAARVLLGSLFGGTLLGPAFIMSIGGAFCSIFCMTYIHRNYGHLFSFVGISVSGAVSHSIAQVVLASFIVYSPGLLWYAPYILLFAIPTGLFTGVVVAYFFAKVPVWHRPETGQLK